VSSRVILRDFVCEAARKGKGMEVKKDRVHKFGSSVFVRTDTGANLKGTGGTMEL
jgi:hypothetical protein